jgi:hypothetical protein
VAKQSIKIKIIYVLDKTAAFMLADELYYIKTVYGFPQLFDHSLKQLIIPNMDYWLQFKTQQRYTYRGLQDMIEAFADGLHHSYSREDISRICDHLYDATIDYIFKTKNVREFARLFWIEILEPEQVKKLVVKIKNSFDEFLEKHGSDKLYNYLCRLWHFCLMHSPSEAPVLERLIQRLNRSVMEPHWPTSDVISNVKGHIINVHLADKIKEYKGVPKVIKLSVDSIHKSEVPGS